jgi:hypothetical protein
MPDKEARIDEVGTRALQTLIQNNDDSGLRKLFGHNWENQHCWFCGKTGHIMRNRTLSKSRRLPNEQGLGTEKNYRYSLCVSDWRGASEVTYHKSREETYNYLRAAWQLDGLHAQVATNEGDDVYDSHASGFQKNDRLQFIYDDAYENAILKHHDHSPACEAAEQAVYCHERKRKVRMAGKAA